MCNVGLRQALIEHVGRARLREGVSGQANPATEMGAVDARKRVSQAPAQRVLLWHISLLVQYFPRLFGIPKGHLDFFFPPFLLPLLGYWVEASARSHTAIRPSTSKVGVGAPTLLRSPVGAHARGHGPSLREPPAISALPRPLAAVPPLLEMPKAGGSDGLAPCPSHLTGAAPEQPRRAGGGWKGLSASPPPAVAP